MLTGIHMRNVGSKLAMKAIAKNNNLMLVPGMVADVLN